MSTLLAILLAAALPQADKPQDKPESVPEMKWTIKEDDKFDFKWTYAEQSKRDNQGKTFEMFDKRDIDAELSYKEEGNLLMTLKKVTWNYGNQDFDASFTYVDGKPPVVNSKVKADPKGPTYKTAVGQAEIQVEQMKKLVDGEYGIRTQRTRNEFVITETVLTLNGGPNRGGFSLFDKIFTHSLLPYGAVKVGQGWRDPPENLALPQGLVEIKDIEYKVATVNDKVITVKGGVSVPINKPGTTLGQNITGNFTLTREWSFSRDEYLQSCKDESTSNKKVDAKGQFAFVYNETSSHTIKQAVLIKKRPAAKPK